MPASLIPLEIIHQLVELNQKVINCEITHPAALAMALEEITIMAWRESQELGGAGSGEIEILPPSLRID